MKDRAEGLEKVAAADHAQQLSPGTATGMAVGAEIAPAHPAPIGAVRVGAEMRGGIHLAAASSRHDDTRWWGCRGVWAGGTHVCTGVAMGLGGEARKGFRLTTALGPWGWGLQRRWASGGRVAWPRPLEHDAQPYECDQRELVEEKMRYHGKTPSYTC
jgi:hypothetical protein